MFWLVCFIETPILVGLNGDGCVGTVNTPFVPMIIENIPPDD